MSTSEQAGKSSNDRAIGIAFVVVLIVGSLAIGFGPQLMRGQEQQRLVAEGVAANATILALKDTGNRANDNPEVELRLRVEPEGVAPFEAKVILVLGAVELQNYALGSVVPVMYDPQDPSAVTLAGPPQLPSAAPADPVVPAEPAAPAPTEATPTAPAP